MPTRPEDIPGGLPAVDRLMDLIAQDKKVKRGMLTFILVRGIGAAFVETGVDQERCARVPQREACRAMTIYDWLTVAAVVICLLVSAFFSASETALTASSRAAMMRLEKQGNQRRDHRQSPAGDPRAAARRAAVRQQRGQYRRLDAGDRPVAGLVRPRRRDLRHDRDDGADLRLRRSAAEDRRLQRARSHGACGRPADRPDGALVFADSCARSNGWCA